MTLHVNNCYVVCYIDTYLYREYGEVKEKANFFLQWEGAQFSDGTEHRKRLIHCYCD